jgi:hypothetical protein
VAQGWEQLRAIVTSEINLQDEKRHLIYSVDLADGLSAF